MELILSPDELNGLSNYQTDETTGVSGLNDITKKIIATAGAETYLENLMRPASDEIQRMWWDLENAWLGFIRNPKYQREQLESVLIPTYTRFTKKQVSIIYEQYKRMQGVDSYVAEYELRQSVLDAWEIGVQLYANLLSGNEYHDDIKID